MSLTYAGVPLCMPTPECEDWIMKNIPLRDVFEESVSYYAGHPLSNLPLAWDIFDGNPCLNTLYWPRGAERWSFGFFLVDDASLQTIRQTVFGGTYAPQTLHMDDGVNPALETSLWMLPPKPLAQDSLWIITLVDNRFFWWASSSGTYQVNFGTDTWTTTIDTLGAAIGESISFDDTTNYYQPPAGLTPQPYMAVPRLLDSVGRQIGQRLVRDLDGTVHFYGYNSSALLLQKNLTSFNPPRAGGDFQFDNTVAYNSLPALVPANIEFLFPRSTNSNTFYNKTLTLTGLSLPEFANVTGYSGTKTVYSEQIALGGGTPSNQSTLDSLATQLAKDWYHNALGSVDATFNGLISWQPEGLTFAIEWKYRQEDCSTRVYRNGLDSEDIPNVTSSSGGGGGTAFHGSKMSDISDSLGGSLSLVDSTYPITPYWTGKDYDTDSYANGTVGFGGPVKDHQFIAPVGLDGYYQVHADVQFVPPVNTFTEFHIEILPQTGRGLGEFITEVAFDGSHTPSTALFGLEPTAQVDAVVHLSAGDYVTVQLGQSNNTASSVQVLGGHFSVTFLGNHV